MSSLRERILATRQDLVSEPTPEVPVETGPAEDAPVDHLQPSFAPPPPPKRPSLPPEVYAEVHRRVVKELGPLLYDDTVQGEELEARLRETIVEAFLANQLPTQGELFHQFVDDLRNDVIGFGPIEEFLNDDSVTEIMVNGPEIVFVERAGKVIEVPSGFVDGNHVRRVIDKIVANVGRRIDEAQPMVDARLPDGSRVNAVIPPLALDGPFLTIRKFSADPFMAADLVRFGTLDERSVRFLRACIEGKLNIVVSGGTGTGKTTLLNVLSSFIPNDERIVTVEDAKELQLHQRHVLCMETRPPNVERTGEITIRDLVKNSLRMRPDRIVVGECRGGEALDMLQAMNTGHDGSMTTVHSNSPRDALSRIETLTLMAGFDLPIRAIREQVASAVDLIVQLTRLRDGTRRVTHITEVDGMEGEKITLQDIFLFDFAAGVDPGTGKHRGRLEPTGVRPAFSDKLEDAGIAMTGDIFESEGTKGLRERMAELR
ncbi:MAG TPA: CpaF family protein [Acidimicrobiales bacterium]|nr:CpaF family protein [Acidimicrobiales bacterium]